VAAEQLPGAVEHRGEVDRREDELDGLLDDLAVDVDVAAEDGETVANHGAVCTEISVIVSTGPRCVGAIEPEKRRKTRGSGLAKVLL
jgi:hypothetical protein